MTASNMELGRQWQERFPCPSCSKSFVRKAHMLRHQQQHIAQRPFTCHFCSKCFKRSDVLRAHQFRCKERGDAPVPEGQSKGRKRSSCLSCVKLRTKCDQETPCGRCHELGKDCVRASSPRNPTEGPRPRSREAISIHHLLNAPDGDDLAPRFPIHDTPPGNGGDEDDNTVNEAENSPDASRWSEEYEPNDVFVGAAIPDFDGVSFDSFFDGFESMTFGSYPLNHEISQLTSGTGVVSSSELMLEPRAFEVRQLLHNTMAKMASEHPENPDLSLLASNIELLTHVEMDHCLQSYFTNYHRHCPILHRPSFHPTLAPDAVLLACIALGAMYSDPIKISWMKGLLDLIEQFIFSLPSLNEEYFGTLGYLQMHDEEALNYHFQTFQGAYLCVVVQYFSGNLPARRRARRQRFLTVVNLARYFGLPAAQHPKPLVIPDESAFQRWVRNECRIRTMNVLMALDAAMGIFNNVPPRTNCCELDLQLPCSSEYFQLTSYAEMLQRSAFPRVRMTLVEAFQKLFVSPSDLQATYQNEVLCCWDLLYLIHVMFTHCWQNLFANPLNRISPIALTPEPQLVYEPMKMALANWKTLWDDVRAKLPRASAKEMGFESSADSYWTLIRMLVLKFENKKTPNSAAGSANGAGFQQTAGATAKRDSGASDDGISEESSGSRDAGAFIPNLDFMPLEADCDNQGAHLRKILSR